MLGIKEIRSRVLEIGQQIGLDGNSTLYPAFSEPDKVFNEGASIYITPPQYHYIIFERGKVIKHYKSEKIENILYPLFKNITIDLASEYELKHRSKHEDTRKLRWKKQLELLEIVDREFYEKRKKEIEEILKTFPYAQSEFIVLPLKKPCNIRRFRLSNPQTVCTFPCFFPYGLKQGKVFYSPLTTLSSSRAELRFASLVEWA